MLKIYTQRLANGKDEQLLGQTTADELQIEPEKELKITGPISFQGSASVVQNQLIVQLDIKARFSMPCSVCNQWKEHPLELKNHYITPEPESIRSGVYCFAQDLREAVLLEMPLFQECNDTNCPKKKEIEPYLKKAGQNQPFKSCLQDEQ